MTFQLIEPRNRRTTPEDRIIVSATENRVRLSFGPLVHGLLANSDRAEIAFDKKRNQLFLFPHREQGSGFKITRPKRGASRQLQASNPFDISPMKSRHCPYEQAHVRVNDQRVYGVLIDLDVAAQADILEESK